MKRILLSAALLFLGTCVAHAGELPQPSQANSISRAVFGDGRLWLLTDDGAVSAITPGAKLRLPGKLPDRVLDLCATGGVVQLLTCPREGCGTWSLRRLEGGHWDVIASVASNGEPVVAAQCVRPGAMTVLSSGRLVEIEPHATRAVALSGRLPIEGVASMHATQADVFVGINAGEWGGGLRRIDRQTGKVDAIDRRGHELCSGPLNGDCDPVNAIVDDPWKDGCLVVAIGLVHFAPHGRLDEICGDHVDRLWFRAFPTEGRERKPLPGEEPFRTEAFFGLARSGSALMAVGLDGLYRFQGHGEPMRMPLPEFETIDGVAVSFALPDVVLVLTGINQRRSLSGTVPLLVPR